MHIHGVRPQTPLTDIDATIQATEARAATANQAEESQQVQAEKSEAQLANEEQTPLGQNAKTTRLEKKEKPRAIENTSGESVLVSIEDSEFDSFKKQGNNSDYKLPQEKFTSLAKALNPKDHNTPQKILDLVLAFLPSASVDPTVIYKAFDYLAQVVEAKIQKATGGEKVSFQELKDNINVAKETYYKANQKIIDLTTSSLLKIAALSVDLREQESLVQLAQSVFAVIKDLKPTDATMQSANLIKQMEKLAPDSKKTTVDRGFDALLKLMSEKLVDPHTHPTDRGSLQLKREAVNQAKIKYREIHAKDLKNAADMSQPLREVLMKMRDIVFNQPQTVFDKAHKHVNDYKGLIKEANELFHYIGSLVKNANLENTELGRIIDECKTLQAAKQVPIQVEKQVPVHERRLVTMGVLSRP